MRKYLLLLFAFGLLGATLSLHFIEESEGTVYSPSARPLNAFPSAFNPQFDLLGANYASLAPTDTLSEAEVASRFSRLYGYQSDILAAQATGDSARAGRLIDRAVREMGRLMLQPGIAERPRFRHLYQSLVSEYEAYYGAPDTLALPQGMIFRIRTEMFAEIDAADGPLLEEALWKELQPMETTVEMPLNGLTRAALRYLQREPENHVYRWMRRAETYFPMIEHIFAEEGLPDELKYLALVESGLNPQAHSRASAAGIWQLMPATARAYGLEINPWVDERLDPEKSTRAAALLLQDLYRLFGGDWHLALAGYNLSPTVVRRALRRAERRLGRRATFWDIYSDIPRETRNYVPTFVAAALMLSNPDAFDLKRVPPGPRYRYDRVPVDGMLSLETVAQLAGTSVEKIRALNPSLRQNTLPPSPEPYVLRLPYGSYDRFAANYDALSASEKGLALTHRVRTGETLDDVAARYYVEAERLRRLNDLEDAAVSAGQSLAVPLISYGTAAGDSTALQEPTRVEYSTRLERPIAVKGSAPGHTNPRRVITHLVRPGDTLHGIARRYEVSVFDLQRWNSLNATEMLRPGQLLEIQTG